MAPAIPSRHGFYDECLLGPVKFSLRLSHRTECGACDDADMPEALPDLRLVHDYGKEWSRGGG
jgi:hypothetical protein